jgi:septal ring factor EnvC (AmiA/AmiB activator)
VAQAKFLLKTYYKLEECEKLDSITTQQLLISLKAIESKDKSLNIQKDIIGKLEETIKLQKASIDNLVEVINDQNDDIKRLQRKNVVVSVVGATGTLFMTLLWIRQAL